MARIGPFSRARTALVAMILVAATTILVVPMVLAGTAISIGPSIPTGGGAVTVGDTGVLANLSITNNSTSPENVGTISVTNATLTVVPGVFSLSATGTGDASTPGCTGSTWNITGGPTTFTFTPTSPVNLTSTHASPPTTTFDCQINFTVNVLTRPATEPTAYTANVAGVWSVDGTTPATGSGASSTTINKVSPTLPTTPSAGGPIGTVLNDSATVTGGSSPTGTVDFKLFAPGDTTCSGTALYTQSGVALVAGTASTSPGFTTLVAGTYHWTAHYNGDGNNNTADSGCTAEPVVITALPVVQVTKTANPVGPVTAGNPIGFDVTVANIGTVLAHGVSLNDPLPTLPAGIGTWTISSGPTVTGTVTPAPTCGISANTLTCTAVDMAVGASYTLHVSAPTATSTNGTATNTATITSTDGNCVVGNADTRCSSTARVTITPAATANLTPGFWKTHNAATSALLPQTLGTYSVTTYADAKIILSGMGCGSVGALNCMAGMLLAAELNLAQGGSTCIQPVVDQANALLVKYSYSGFKPYTLSASDQTLAKSLHDLLSAYNIDGIPTC